MTQHKAVKITWWSEELDKYHRGMGSKESICKDNEGMPFGIAQLDNDTMCEDIEWFATEQERDNNYKEDL